MKNRILFLIALVICLCFLVGCDFKIPTSNNPTNTENIITSSGEENTTIANEADIKYDEVKVASAKDLFQNIKPNTRIILTEDYYNISKIDPYSFKSEYAYLEDSFDGYEIVVHDVDHIEICSSNDVIPEIVSESPHANVINFKDCNNIKISNIVAGHAVEKGTCSGGVFYLEDTSNVEINKCRLYGCGTYGLVTQNANYVTVNDTEIYECTYGIMDLYQSNHWEFNNCTFKDSEGFTMFVISDCNNIKYNDCTIRGNLSDYSGSLIGSYESTNIVFSKCLFENNSYDYLCSIEDDIKFNSCKSKDANFNERFYPDYSDEDYDDYYEDYDYYTDYDFDYEYN